MKHTFLDENEMRAMLGTVGYFFFFFPVAVLLLLSFSIFILVGVCCILNYCHSECRAVQPEKTEDIPCLLCCGRRNDFPLMTFRFILVTRRFLFVAHEMLGYIETVFYLVCGLMHRHCIATWHKCTIFGKKWWNKRSVHSLKQHNLCQTRISSRHR